MIAKLSEMRYLIMTDKPLEEFSAESAADAAIWNGEIQEQSKVCFQVFRNLKIFTNEKPKD